MNDNSTEVGSGGHILALLAAATTLSPDETNGTIPNSSLESPFINNLPNVANISNDFMSQSAFLTREAKVEMVPRGTEVVIPNAVNNQMQIQVVEVSTRETLQPSPMTASISMMNSTTTSIPSETTSQRASNMSTSMPTFNTENVRFNVDSNGNTLSVPSARTPDKSTEKNYYNFENGYDTDEDIGPFWDAVDGEEDIDDDVEAFPLDTDERREERPQEQPAVLNVNDAAVPLTEAVIRTMLNSELKAELKKRGLSQNGNKTVLTKRLLDNLHKPITTEDEPEQAPNGFSSSAQWRQLINNPTPIEEPTRPSNMRGPTVPEGENEFKKFDFPDTFDRPPFTEMSEIYETDRNGKVVKNRQGKIQTTSEIRYEGRANSEWLKKNKLTNKSKPSEWFEALLPLKRNANDPASLVTINEWTTYSNKKAMLTNAGAAGGVYYDWKPFSPKEVQQFLALYIFQGLSPSPQMKMKFLPQHEDPINGSDMCFKVFGRNGDRRHKMFKAFFSCQDPLKAIP